MFHCYGREQGQRMCILSPPLRGRQPICKGRSIPYNSCPCLSSRDTWSRSQSTPPVGGEASPLSMIASWRPLFFARSVAQLSRHGVCLWFESQTEVSEASGIFFGPTQSWDRLKLRSCNPCAPGSGSTAQARIWQLSGCTKLVILRLPWVGRTL